MSQEPNNERSAADVGFASSVEEIPASARRDASEIWHARQRDEPAPIAPRKAAYTPIGTWLLLAVLLTVGASLTGLALFSWPW